MSYSDEFFKFKINFLKFALSSREDVDLDDFINVKPKDIQVITEPFPHIIVENFFKPEIYEMLCDKFEVVEKRGLTKAKKDYGDQFHAFDIDYDGYVYTPPASTDPADPLRLFYSLEWNGFFSKKFHQFTTFETILAFHHHPTGDRSGFVHNDYADKPFSSQARLPNGIMYHSDTGKPNRDARRIIAILFYLKNDSWREGDGGETGIYSADGKVLLKKVAPINNTLFAFQISKKSMHAFQENHLARNSFVQWFHIPKRLEH
jgi:2OG-Fe(II) oxygenase superfamily